jgi:hypothetical protein
LLTSYVDNEVSDADRLIVEDHLKHCESCRRRLVRHKAVHELLRHRTEEAHVRGTTLPWSPRTFRPTLYRVGRAFVSLSVLAVAGVVLGMVIWSRVAGEAGTPLSARGQISDSACRGNHGRPGSDRMTMTGRQCVERCIEKGAQYVFVSAGDVYPIRNQQFADLARFAEQAIELEGRVQHSQLTVSRITPLDLSYGTHLPPSGGTLAEVRGLTGTGVTAR